MRWINPITTLCAFTLSSAAEKYLKACLQEADISFRKTHDLSELLDSTLSIDPTLESLRHDLNSLSAFAVEYRYPGESADLDEAQEAYQKCKNVREIIRRALQLED